MASDFELLDAWQLGDRAAGNALIERHFDSLYRFFDRKVHADVADLVQKTFLACVESKERFARTSSFRTYLFSIARRKLYDHWRTRSRRPETDLSSTSIVDLGMTPSAIHAGKQEQRLLLEALRNIPLESQLLLELHYWEGLTGPQLAEAFEIPEGTVRSRLARARSALEATLQTLAQSPGLLASTMSDSRRLGEVPARAAPGRLISGV